MPLEQPVALLELLVMREAGQRAPPVALRERLMLRQTLPHGPPDQCSSQRRALARSTVRATAALIHLIIP
jgi:hypothetical protein